MHRQYFTLKTVGAILILFSCSSPKYTYNFDYYDYNSGKKMLDNHSNESLTETNAEPLKIDRNKLVATTEKEDVISSDQTRLTDPKVASKTAVPFDEFSKAEKKQLRRELRDYVKNHAKERKPAYEGSSARATNQLDDDLKLAIIFGAIGITFAILGGINTVFWVIGVIGLIVGLVFFIRWISTQ
jgi:hypothetical protein